MALIVFDCDGVLVDSECIADRVLERFLTEQWPDRDIAPLVRDTAGLTTAAVLERAAETTGRALPTDALARVEQVIQQALDAELQAVPGAAEALDAIALPGAVASNSSLARIERSLRRTGLIDRFDGRLFSAEMVARPKPHPDLYRHIAERLAVAPDDCLVVEDSVAGTTAARAAGMAVIGFTGASHSGPGQIEPLLRAGALEVIARMTELPVRVERWRSGIDSNG